MAVEPRPFTITGITFDPNTPHRPIVKTDSPDEAAAALAMVRAHYHSQIVLKLGLYGMASLFLIVAALLVVYAPEGRQTLSAIIGAALVVVAAGSAGFGSFRLKGPLVEISGGGRSDMSDDVGDGRNISSRNPTGPSTLFKQ